MGEWFLENQVVVACFSGQFVFPGQLAEHELDYVIWEPSTPMIPRALSLFWVVVWCCFFSFICFLVFFVYSMCTWCTFSCAFNLLIYLSIYIYIYAYLWQGADLPSTQVAYMDHPKFPTRPKKREKERTKTNIRPSEGT